MPLSLSVIRLTLSRMKIYLRFVPNLVAIRVSLISETKKKIKAKDLPLLIDTDQMKAIHFHL